MNLNQNLERNLQALKQHHRELRKLSTEMKNTLLLQLAGEIEKQSPTILASNQVDLQNLPAETNSAFRDRLTLNPQRLSAMAAGLQQIAAQPDPVGELVDGKILANGLKLKRIRAPLGIVFLIFESRPNVILEAFALAFKSGNSLILRGGSDSAQTSHALYALMAETLSKAGVQHPVFYGIEDYNRDLVEILLRRKDLIDVVVPRGGEKLIEFVQKTALMPLIKNDRGLCHTYVDEDADLDMAVRIVANAKTQRPGVCNSLETVLVHKNCASLFIPQLYAATSAVKLAWRVDSATQTILQDSPHVQLASNLDWDTEHLDQIINCRVIESLDQALEHIEHHGSHHSEAIVTRSEQKARRFQEEVDAAAVYWNASTRFTDGYEFGLGGELGISTQKLHVRGPVGLRELTTPRWIIDGNGQIR